MGELHMAAEDDTPTPATDPETHTVSVTVETTRKPRFELTWPVDGDETVADAIDRATDLARHDASIALSDTAHEYEWDVRDIDVTHGEEEEDA